ncbi:MAG: alpha/beta hydrolase [Pseudomonadota bacterium]
MGPLLAALSPDLEARAIDLPGHGAAPDWDGTRDYGEMARDLAAEALDGPAHVIGHSYGAYVALRLAVDRPDLVASLSLYEPVFFAAAVHADPELAEAYGQEAAAFIAPLEVGRLEEAAQAFFEYWGGGVPWDGLRPEQKAYITARIPQVGASEPSLVADSGAVWDRLVQVQVPCLLMSGAGSPAITGAILDALQMKLPQAERVQIAGAGHMGPVSHAREIAAVIKEFLNL